jgi:prepilin-type N-terminal cleavage/methylation domain-containing protein
MRVGMKSMLEREEGFTLVELMVTVAILAVLLLMSTSTYAGAKSRSQDSAAKTVATRAVQTGRVVFTDQATYATVDTTALTAAEKSMTFLDAAVGSTNSDEASTDVPDRATTAEIFVAAVYSEAGNCFYIRDWVVAGPAGGVAYGVLLDTAPADCTADNADDPALAWVATWP